MKRPLLSSILTLAALLLQPSESRAAAFEPFGNGVLYRINGNDPPEARRVCMVASGTITTKGRLIVNTLIRPNGFCTSAGFIVVPWVEWAEPVSGHHTITFTAYSEATGAIMAQYTISVFLNATALPSAALHVRAALGTDAPVPAGGVALPTTARVALGSLVTFEAITSDGDVVPARFTLLEASVANGVAPEALFPGQVLIAYNSSALHRRSFQAVHRGQVAIRVEPDDTSMDAGTVTVIVESPAALGTAHNDIDAALFAVAHRWGVPPQFIKAHAHKESAPHFNRMSYRYEPIGPWVGDLMAVSRATNLRTVSPYSAYRLATERDTANPALTAGAQLSPADRDVRGNLTIECDEAGNTGRNIVPADDVVPAWEIFRCNDARMNWKKQAGAAGQGRADRLQSDPFTAQTGLAASYGLLQVTYVTAMDELRWTGTDGGAQNPSLLFDTDENLTAGGGSVSLGTLKVVRAFKQIEPDLALGGAVSTNAAAMLASFIKAWNRYNPGEPGYGASVASRVTTFGPLAAVAVFGGQQ